MMSFDYTHADNRRALPPGFSLVLSEDNGNAHKVDIKRELGHGGSCIVYKGIMESVGGTSKSVIVKEFWPEGLGIFRSEKNENLSIPKDAADIFTQLRTSFEEGIAKHSEFFESYSESAFPRVFLYGRANNTCYAVSDAIPGKILTKACTKDMSLARIASIMESLCAAIEKLHVQQKLYLDCKPDNLFYNPGSDDVHAQIYLFDFETVSSLSDIKAGKNIWSPYSPDWSPEEQIPSEFDGRYKDPDLIAYHTDIYAVGEVFFFLLTGRRPEGKDISAINNDSFDWEKDSDRFRETDRAVQDIIRDLCKRMLNPDPCKRKEEFRQYISIRGLKIKFGALYGMTLGDDRHFEPIHKRIDMLSSDIKKIEQSLNSGTSKKTFGRKKRHLVTACAFATAALTVGFLSAIVSKSGKGTF